MLRARDRDFRDIGIWALLALGVDFGGAVVVGHSTLDRRVCIARRRIEAGVDPGIRSTVDGGAVDVESDPVLVAWLPGQGDRVGTLVYAGSREFDDELGILASIGKRDISGHASRRRGSEDEGKLDASSGLKGHWQREGSD